MRTPFPGMDPYLEHPVLYPSLHNALAHEFRKQLRPLISPRYIVSTEERIVIESLPHARLPDVWIKEGAPLPTTRPAAADLAAPIIVETQEVPRREVYLEILDRYRDEKVVTVIEILSPTNKSLGGGREEYLVKQEATLASEAHLVEVDLLRRGAATVAAPQAHLDSLGRHDYLICVSRFPSRSRFELFPIQMREKLPRFGVPLSAPDPDVPLDVQAALETVYEDASYMFHVKYDEPCEPALSDEDQTWAGACWREFQQRHPEWFSTAAHAGNGRPS